MGNVYRCKPPGLTNGSEGGIIKAKQEEKVYRGRKFGIKQVTPREIGASRGVTDPPQRESRTKGAGDGIDEDVLRIPSHHPHGKAFHVVRLNELSFRSKASRIVV